MSALSDPATGGASVTPNDSTNINVTTALWVGTQGTLTVTMMDGSKITFTGAVGWMPIRVTRVWATGTSASDITAVWRS